VQFGREMFRNNIYGLRRKVRLLVTNKTYGDNESLQFYQTDAV
jgi:hypothetical protein